MYLSSLIPSSRAVALNLSSSGFSGRTCPPIILPRTVPSSRVIGIPKSTNPA
jgi:hypothetical protein